MCVCITAPAFTVDFSVVMWNQNNWWAELGITCAFFWFRRKKKVCLGVREKGLLIKAAPSWWWSSLCEHRLPSPQNHWLGLQGSPARWISELGCTIAKAVGAFFLLTKAWPYLYFRGGLASSKAEPWGVMKFIFGVINQPLKLAVQPGHPC